MTPREDLPDWARRRLREELPGDAMVQAFRHVTVAPFLPGVLVTTADSVVFAIKPLVGGTRMWALALPRDDLTVTCHACREEVAFAGVPPERFHCTVCGAEHGGGPDAYRLEVSSEEANGVGSAAGKKTSKTSKKKSTTKKSTKGSSAGGQTTRKTPKKTSRSSTKKKARS